MVESSFLVFLTQKLLEHAEAALAEFHGGQGKIQ